MTALLKNPEEPSESEILALLKRQTETCPGEMIASPVYTEPLRVAPIMAGFRYP
jgi:hypothetical protein